MAITFDLSKVEGFEWDKGNLGHINKHKVKYTECEEIFGNIPFVAEDEVHSEIEERFHALGKANRGRLLFVSFTIRNKKIRVISARDQDRKEKVQTIKARGETK